MTLVKEKPTNADPETKSTGKQNSAPKRRKNSSGKAGVATSKSRTKPTQTKSKSTTKRIRGKTDTPTTAKSKKRTTKTTKAQSRKAQADNGDVGTKSAKQTTDKRAGAKSRGSGKKLQTRKAKPKTTAKKVNRTIEKSVTKEPETIGANLEAALGKTEQNIDQVEIMRAEGRKAAELERRIANGEKLLKELKRALHYIKSHTLPNAMQQIQFSDFTLEDGTKIKIHDIVSGSLPKDHNDQVKALNHIRDLGGESIIKSTFEIVVDKEDTTTVSKVRKAMDDIEAVCVQKQSVHNATLKSFVKEAMANGEPVNLDLLGIYAGKYAKVTLPKTD